MFKLLFLAGAASVVCKLVFGRWPWEFLRSTPTRAHAVFRARMLLAVPAEASRDEVLAAHRRLIALVHPDKGGSGAAVHEANAARDLLLDDLPYES